MTPKRTLLITAGALLLTATPARAQNLDSLRAAYRIELPPTIYVAASPLRSAPGSSASSPSAYGANWGDGFIGVGGQARTRYTESRVPDGSAVAGLGLGNARDLIGLELAFTSLSTFRQGFLTNSAMSVKLHRALPRNFAIAIGLENIVVLGAGDADESFYGVISSVFPLRSEATDPLSTLTVSLGAGNGRFRSEDDVLEQNEGIGFFGSAGLRLLEPLSLIADWTGQDLVLALSLVPFVRVPLILTPGIADVTGTAGDGARFVMGAGMGFQFAGLRHIFSGRRSGDPRPQVPPPPRTTPRVRPDTTPAGRPTPAPADSTPAAVAPAAVDAPAPLIPAAAAGAAAAAATPIDSAQLSMSIFFDDDDAALTPLARAELDAKLHAFRTHPELAIRIEGHADARGTDAYNQTLGERRAIAARDYLIAHGIDASRIYIVSFGEELPACPRGGQSCLQVNRRAEFKIGVIER